MSDLVEQGRLAWAATSRSGSVSESLRAPDSEDLIVLLDPELRPAGVLPWHPYPNLARVQASGTVKWVADPLSLETTAKCWTGIAWRGERLIAYTYSYECQIEPMTGEIVEATFTK